MKKKILIIIIVIVALSLTTVGVILQLSIKKEQVLQRKIDINKDFDTIKQEVYEEIGYANQYLNHLYPISSMDSIDNKYKLEYIIGILSQNNKKLTENNIKKEYQKHLLSLKYSKNLIEENKGKTSMCSMKSTYIDEKYDNKKYVVSANVYYQRIGLEETESTSPKYIIKVYKNYEDCKNDKNELINKKSSGIILTEEENNKIENNLTKYTYKLKNTNGYYILDSIEAK